MHIFKHFCTVMEHKTKVFIHCVRAGIPLQGIVHDLSKFSPTEFIPSAKYYTGICSPIPLERGANGYSKAWIHHKAKNKHHIEYWTDYINNDEVLVPVEIPTKYVVEMFCDMLAANKVYHKNNHKDTDGIEYFWCIHLNVRMHEKSAKLLETFFEELAQNGEEAAFEYIRKFRRNEKKMKLQARKNKHKTS